MSISGKANEGDQKKHVCTNYWIFFFFLIMRATKKKLSAAIFFIFLNELILKLASSNALDRKKHGYQELHWHHCSADEPGYTAGIPLEVYSQTRGGHSFPWMITVD